MQSYVGMVYFDLTLDQNISFRKLASDHYNKFLTTIRHHKKIRKRKDNTIKKAIIQLVDGNLLTQVRDRVVIGHSVHGLQEM